MEAQGGGRLNWTKGQKCLFSGDMNFEAGPDQMEVGMNCKILGATEVGIQNYSRKIGMTLIHFGREILLTKLVVTVKGAVKRVKGISPSLV